MTSSPGSSLRDVSAKTLRWKLTEVLNEACFRGARYRVLKNGKPVAFLIGIEDYNRCFPDEAGSGVTLGPDQRNISE
jgi:prevent-host-death family protein